MKKYKFFIAALFSFFSLCASQDGGDLLVMLDSAIDSEENFPCWQDFNQFKKSLTLFVSDTYKAPDNNALNEQSQLIQSGNQSSQELQNLKESFVGVRFFYGVNQTKVINLPRIISVGLLAAIQGGTVKVKTKWDKIDILFPVRLVTDGVGLACQVCSASAISHKEISKKIEEQNKQIEELKRTNDEKDKDLLTLSQSHDRSENRANNDPLGQQGVQDIQLQTNRILDQNDKIKKELAQKDKNLSVMASLFVGSWIFFLIYFKLFA